MSKNVKKLKFKGNAHIAFNVLPKENESSFFYHGSDNDLAMMLATAAACDERFDRILFMACHLEITFEDPA